jgi:oligopeptidase B
VGPADRKGPVPTLLYGYGSYGMTVDPSFSVARLSLLERGMAYAIAHVRGGEYLGRMWYEQGRMADKQNTFSDFIACGDFLKSEAWASDLFAMGGSAGGLLVAAVVNQRPDLWSGVIAAVPFVDVVTTMLDDSIPLTTGEYDEWGNPNEAEAYFCMKAYSPYDNVRAQDYPPMLVTTGLHDSQVQYFEPAKWVARLRDRRTNSAPLYMYCNMDTGHGGASGRYESYRETAMEYAFLLGLKA